MKRGQLLGQRFGRWKVTGEAGRSAAHNVLWNCRCECGATRLLTTAALRGGQTKSCGCLNREICANRLIQHGHCRRNEPYSSEYHSWKCMIYRCGNSNHKYYANYGGRGIKVCERWKTFARFLEDMGRKPKGYTIERIDGNKGYEPGNCKWASRHEQSRNTRHNHMVTAFGKTMCIADWAIEAAIGYKVLHHRIRKGVPPEKAISTPVRSCSRA